MTNLNSKLVKAVSTAIVKNLIGSRPGLGPDDQAKVAILAVADWLNSLPPSTTDCPAFRTTAMKLKKEVGDKSLSPVTKEAVEAFENRYELCGPFDSNWVELCLAEALRVLANKAGSPISNGRIVGSLELLEMAAELEDYRE